MGIRISINDGSQNQVASFSADERSFSSGNKGYLSNGVATIDGKKYRCHLRLVEMVPKPKKIPPEVMADTISSPPIDIQLNK